MQGHKSECLFMFALNSVQSKLMDMACVDNP